MAYVNVAEWSPEHVAEWLRGLEYSLLPYVHFFLNNEINGCHLLNLTADDLEDLHIFKVGHQQLILEAVELLRQLHYNLTSETLQSLAVKLGCKARSLYNDLKLNGPQEHIENVRQERVSMNVLSAVSEILTSVKALVSWLDRLPFQRDEPCKNLKKTVLKLSIELASTTQRDQFAERPHSLIKRNSLHLAELCDKFVQDSKDSLILQPASLDIAMIKKKPDEELGIHIKSTYSGVHIIGGIKDQSPAKRCNKVEKGDEIIQVNYQTIIGWQQKKLVTAMTEHSTELHLTLKKRPRHINISGEVIILRPYRIPSKKTANKCHKWSEDNHLRGQDTCSTSNESECMRDEFNDDDDDSAFLPADATADLILTPEMPMTRRLFPYMSPAAVQRRATVSGASPTVLKPPINIEDLVNGVPRIKTGENFGRSISHDPTCHKLNVTNSKSEDQLEIFKRKNETKEKLDERDASKVLLVPATFNTDDRLSGDNAFEALPLEEEESPMFENKSLSKTDESCGLKKETSDEFASSSKNDTLSDCSSIDSQIADKHTTVLYNWDGVDTEFCGRRPSVQDIANEVAGSKVSDITPVFLRKASKLETSPSKQSSATVKDAKEMSSYQVVVVGGVPQMCRVDKDRKDKSKGLEAIAHGHRKKEKRTKKFASRRISCKDLGKGDCEGFLYKQKEKRGFLPSSYQWTKRWIVLKDNFLYSYRDINDQKAECLISLPGSTVSPALECKTKKYSFKVCQPKATFYFASETLVDLKKWMNKMGLAAIAYDASLNVSRKGISSSESVLGVISNFYSETEDSDCGSPATTRNSEMKSLSSKSHSEAKQTVHYVEETSRSSKLNASCNHQKGKMFSNAYSDYFIKLKDDSGATADPFTPEMGSYPDSHLKLGKNLNTNYRRITYNRSFSCTDSTSNKHNTQNQLIRKMSHESSIRSNFKPVCEQPSMTASANASITWDAADEECDMLTSSLGRQQKAVAKEITPGLVARMAVSYSNLSQKNALMQPGYSKRNNSRKCIPSPGYVAKISDSFDHMAKTISEKPVRLENKEKAFQQALSAKEIVALKQHPACKRSASESQVSKNFANVPSNAESDKYSSYLSSNCALMCSKQKASDSQPKRFVSLLDKEYNKVFEGKKVSSCQLKSQTQFDSKSCGSEMREMKFFPHSELVRSKISLQNHSDTNISPDSSSVYQKKSYDSETLYSGHNEAVDIKCQLNGSNHTSSLPLHSYEGHSTNQNIASNWSSSFHDKTFESSEGIENIGFSYIDHGSIGGVETETPVSFKNSESENKAVDCLESTSFTDQSSLHNLNLPTAASSESGPSRNSSFKFFSSPKFMKKLTSPKLDKRNIFKSKKQGKENKKAEQKELTSVQNEKKFFGSPRLVRAIFGSPKSTKKVVTVSSGVQTDNLPGAISNTEEKKRFHDLNRNESFATALDLCEALNSYAESQNQSNVESKSSSSSSLNSNDPNCPSFPTSHYYVETRIKPQITISLPLVSDKSNENAFSPPETQRTPLKPTMGVAMLSKKRLPSISGESSVSISSKSSHDGSFKESLKEAAQILSGASVDVNTEDEMLKVLESLRRADVSVDGVDLAARRSRSLSIPPDNERMHLCMSLQAHNRTLKVKELELEKIKELLKEPVITHEVLQNWLSTHPYLLS